jgi:hypothetical protein
MPTRQQLEQMHQDATFAENIGLDGEAERQRHRAIWESQEDPGAVDELLLTDRQIAEALVYGNEDPDQSGRALRALGIAVSDEQAHELLAAAQIEGKGPDVVARLMSMDRIDPQEQDYESAVKAIKKARQGRDVSPATSYDITITPME